VTRQKRELGTRQLAALAAELGEIKAMVKTLAESSASLEAMVNVRPQEIERLVETFPDPNRSALLELQQQYLRDNKVSQTWLFKRMETVLSTFGRPDHVIANKSGLQMCYRSAPLIPGKPTLPDLARFRIRDGIVVSMSVNPAR